LEQISETARQNGIEVIWYRYHGNPVALLKFQANEPHPTIQFMGLKLNTGTVSIQGRSLEGATAGLPGLPIQPDSFAAN
jgi:hypothetical protein